MAGVFVTLGYHSNQRGPVVIGVGKQQSLLFEIIACRHRFPASLGGGALNYQQTGGLHSR